MLCVLSAMVRIFEVDYYAFVEESSNKVLCDAEHSRYIFVEICLCDHIDNWYKVSIYLGFSISCRLLLFFAVAMRILHLYFFLFSIDAIVFKYSFCCCWILMAMRMSTMHFCICDVSFLEMFLRKSRKLYNLGRFSSDFMWFQCNFRDKSCRYY